jgi:hypothetical protein
MQRMGRRADRHRNEEKRKQRIQTQRSREQALCSVRIEPVRFKPRRELSRQSTRKEQPLLMKGQSKALLNALLIAGSYTSAWTFSPQLG